jgi:hypothetical protein
MPVATIALAALGLAGCSPTYGYGGYQIYDHFPLDGQRAWEYANDDISIDHKIEVRMSETTVMKGDTEVFEFQFYNQSTGDKFMAVNWSSDGIDGIQIHGYQTWAIADSGGDGGADSGDTGGGPGAAWADALETFEPPVVVADPEMAPGESVESSGGSWSFVSTFEAVEGCPNYYVGDEWNECLRLTLDDGDGDDMSGAPFAGSYWLVPRYGTAWMRLTGDAENWVLVDADWEPDA